MANLGASLHHTKVYEYVNRPTATGSTEQNLSILVRFAVRTGVNWLSDTATYEEFNALRHAVEIATGGFIRRSDLDDEIGREHDREAREDVEEFVAGLLPEPKRMLAAGAVQGNTRTTKVVEEDTDGHGEETRGVRYLREVVERS